MRDERDAEFSDFVAGSTSRLLSAAWLLTGDAAAAEDLLQTALVKTYLAWPRVRQGSPVGYTRRVLCTTYVSWWRRPWRRERATASVPDTVATADRTEETDRRLVVSRALAGLPPRQRAVVVLRYYLDLPEAEIAEVLGCSPGTVKSQAAKALTKLRSSSTLRSLRWEASS